LRSKQVKDPDKIKPKHHLASLLSALVRVSVSIDVEKPQMLQDFSENYSKFCKNSDFMQENQPHWTELLNF